jgi:tRNA-splicing ligase RtcB
LIQFIITPKFIIIHRKGAINISTEYSSIIPGSQGTSTYIIKGTNLSDISYNSAAHRAGRIMSRNNAIKNINLTAEIEKLNNIGVNYHALKHHGFLLRLNII